jgi:hypothetical protein
VLWDPNIRLEGEQVNSRITEKLIEQLQSMPYDLQLQVLEFARALNLSVARGVAGRQLLRFAGVISRSDVELMQAAIAQGCEQVDANEW